ncbi:hypothetical protein TOPH_03029 [Tolypocladium ophioglossoides CBS 100239]|uniref:Uncharacterized protein n=1 Tax=Tolypocladium ophioglossoides (strain CBS 100239) TaxID=1163406 RepID=A0A0L0NE22_TOLOC|nr:hypothetical protein TOPH_03029 [Tolypocladium ophioglossoides CBS 100239]
MGSGGSKEIQEQLHRASAAGVRFPNSFLLFYDVTWTKLSLQLAMDRSRPMYLFNLPKGWHGDMVMYDGPSLDSRPIATATNEGTFGYKSFITIPPPYPGLPPFESELEITRKKSPIETYTFAAPVGKGAKLQLECFSWVSSTGQEVRGLGQWLRGWKLVRSGQKGGEVLAVWADASMRLSKAAKFEFMNSGASGVLGDTWALMAVVSFAKVWQRCMMQAINGSLAS